MSTVRINPLTGFPEVMPDTRGVGIMSGLGSPFASSIRKIAQPIDNGYRGPTQMGPQSIVQPQPRTEEELRAQYDLMRENAKRRRAAGDMSQVVLAGEQPFESFLEMERLGGGLLESKAPMDRVLSDGFFVNDPRRTTPLPSALRSSLKNILADRNLTPEERGALMGPGKEGLDKADFYAFKNTLRDPGDMGRYVAPGEEMSYEDFVKFGRPANLAAAEAAGYGGGALLVNDFGNKVSLGSLIGATPGASEVPSNPSRPISYDPNAPVDPGFSPNLMGAGRRPVDPYARPTPGMLPQPIEINPNYRPDNFRPNPNMYQRPMRRPFGFGGRPMNPFMGMGLGMMNPMGMGMFGGFPMRPPMFGGYGGYGGGYGGYGGGYNMMRPPMGFGLGGANPYGMNPYSNFGRPNPYPQPSYNRPNPYSSGMSFNQPHFGGGVLQQQQGGYGSYQQPSGYGNYGGMQNPYQPQQQPSYQQGGSISNGFGGGIPNNFAGYGQQQAMF